MTDFLPIILARGQNESIDPRVAPADVHKTAQNVRWRKDGRPAKRFGLTSITTTGLDTGGTNYKTQAVNAITNWNDAPLFILGSGIRQFTAGVWTPAATAAFSEISHWGPGERTPIARSEGTSSYRRQTVGTSGGLVLYAWDDGTDVLVAAYTTTGATITPPVPQFIGTAPRLVSCNSHVILVWANGTLLNCATFNPATLVFSGTITIGTLSAAGDHFDAFGRGADFVVVYRSASGTFTSKLLTDVASPITTQTRTHAMVAAQNAIVTISGTSTSSVFIAWIEISSGNLIWTAVNNAMTTVLTGPTTFAATDVNLIDPPGIVTITDHTASIVIGGRSSISGTAHLSYFYEGRVNDSGTVTASFTLFPSCGLASKPFTGPALAALGEEDAVYIWVRQNASSEFDDQRGYYLVRINRFSGPSLQRQMHTPNVSNFIQTPTLAMPQLSDVVYAGAGSGHFVALMNAVRFSVGPECIGVDGISFHSIFESQRYAVRDTVLAGRVMQVAGGSLYEFNGYSEETGFTASPAIISVTATGGSSLSIGTYQYKVVFEWIDFQGRRHRSAPSDAATLTTTTSNQTGTLVVFGLMAQARAGSAVMHVYRTLVGQSSFHRVTPNIGAPTALGGSTLTYVDSLSDTAASVNEFIYTDGGVLPNELCPPCTFLTVCNGRLWVGGQLDRCVITASKLLVDGEPTQFTADATSDVFLPEKCTGIASLDGVVVAFAKEAIYLVSGDGPDDEGNGAFSPPQKLPSDVGCIDWRSVVETSIGVFFQSKRGIYLLPRGFNTPVFVGAEVEDTLRAFPLVVSATLVSIPATTQTLGEVTVRFVVGVNDSGPETRVLIYDLRTQGWSVDRSPASNPYGVCGVWNDTFVVSKVTPNTSVFAAIFAEDPTTFAEEGGFVTTTIGTGDIRPFGVGGYGSFKRVQVMGEYRGDSIVQITTSVDGRHADTSNFTITSADAPDNVVYLDITPQFEMGTSIAVSINDSAVVSTPNEGFIPQTIFIEYELIGKTKRLAAGRRA